MAVKVVNNTAGSDGLIPILLVFGAYLHMHNIDQPAPTIIQKSTAFQTAIEQVRKIRAKNQVINALNTKNKLIINLIYNLLLNSNILIWQKRNSGSTSK